MTARCQIPAVYRILHPEKVNRQQMTFTKQQSAFPFRRGLTENVYWKNKKESNGNIAFIKRLIGQIEKESLCHYLIILVINAEDIGGDSASELTQRLNLQVKL